ARTAPWTGAGWRLYSRPSRLPPRGGSIHDRSLLPASAVTGRSRRARQRIPRPTFTHLGGSVMPHITPLPEAHAGEAKPLFDAVRGKFRMVPNIFRTMGHAPEVLRHTLG